MNHVRHALACCAAALLLCAGCAKPTGTVSGKVTLNGEPLEAGQVIAYNDSKERVGVGFIGDGGAYSIPDLPPGPVTLTVITFLPGGDPALDGYPKTPPNLPQPTSEVRKKQIEALPEKVRQQIEKLKPVPPKYGGHETSDLKVTVKAGSTPYDVTMTGKGEIPRAPVIKGPVGGNAPPPPPPPRPPR